MWGSLLIISINIIIYSTICFSEILCCIFELSVSSFNSNDFIKNYFTNSNKYNIAVLVIYLMSCQSLYSHAPSSTSHPLLCIKSDETVLRDLCELI